MNYIFSKIMRLLTIFIFISDKVCIIYRIIYKKLILYLIVL